MSKNKDGFEDIKNEFVSDDARKYPMKLGKTKASSLSGFIAGVILASIIWYLIVYVFEIVCKG